jgi:hypothetical protein
VVLSIDSLVKASNDRMNRLEKMIKDQRKFTIDECDVVRDEMKQIAVIIDKKFAVMNTS